jgi:5'-nucleotidase
MKKPEVYLDMDGVLADFFTEYAKLAGIESGNYRDIPPAKTDPTLNKMVGTDFFARLPKLRNADELVAMIVKLYGHYHICSSPLRGDHENSEKQKRVWIQKHLKPQPVDIIITPNKAKFAKQSDGTPNILIDDRGSNISAWENAGGIGIKYQADEDGLDVIVAGLTRARKILKGEEEHTPQQLKSLDRSSGKLIAKSGDSDTENPDKEVKESASAGSTSAGGIATASAQGGGWLFGGTVGAPKGAKKKKSKVIKR